MNSNEKPDRAVNNELLSVGDAATYLATGERFVRRLVAERRVPFYKVGAKVRISREDLDRFLARGRIEIGGDSEVAHVLSTGDEPVEPRSER